MSAWQGNIGLPHRSPLMENRRSRVLYQAIISELCDFRERSQVKASIPQGGSDTKKKHDASTPLRKTLKKAMPFQTSYLRKKKERKKERKCGLGRKSPKAKLDPQLSAWLLTRHYLCAGPINN